MNYAKKIAVYDTQCTFGQILNLNIEESIWKRTKKVCRWLTIGAQ